MNNLFFDNVDRLDDSKQTPTDDSLIYSIPQPDLVIPVTRDEIQTKRAALHARIAEEKKRIQLAVDKIAMLEVHLEVVAGVEKRLNQLNVGIKIVDGKEVKK